MRRLSDEVREQIIRLTGHGVTARAIADRLGIHPRTVGRVRDDAGLSQAAGTPMTDDEMRRAKAMLEDGASYNEVARTLGRTHGTITRRLPGYKWDKAKIAEAAAMGRGLASLERQAAVG